MLIQMPASPTVTVKQPSVAGREAVGAHQGRREMERVSHRTTRRGKPLRERAPAQRHG